MLRAGDLQIIRSDFLSLLNGPDSIDAEITWQVGSGALDPVYKTYASYSDFSVCARVHVTKIFRDAEMKKKRFGDVAAGDSAPDRSLTGDGIFMFAKDLDLQGKENVVFVMPSMGRWKLIIDPPPIFHQFAYVVPHAEQFVQYAFVRRLA